MRIAIASAIVLVACGSTKPSSPPPPAPVIASSVPSEPAQPAAKFGVTSIEPDKGDFEGGTYVRIKGRGFLTDDAGNPQPTSAKIYFGSRQGTIVRFAADDELIAEAPGGKVDETADVLLILEGRGELKLPRAFTFIAKRP